MSIRLKLPLIAIDGPSGVGKSTTAKLVAKGLMWNYLDTGAMYRTAALALVRAEVTLTDRLSLSRVLHKLKIQQIGSREFLDFEDVSEAIRTSEITSMSSLISSDADVRAVLVCQQRKICESGNWVVDGRDIGTVVFPNACCKIYLTANAEVRALRRFNELKSTGGLLMSLEQIMHCMKLRDSADSNRAASPLCKAKDAIELNSSNMSLTAVVDWIIDHHLSHVAKSTVATY
jgi:cytidylate kinase